MSAKRSRRRPLALVALTCSLLVSAGGAVAAGPSGKLSFALSDALGREVHSQDYAGVPVYLEFGACW